jgi:hypothetical protein
VCFFVIELLRDVSRNPVQIARYEGSTEYNLRQVRVLKRGSVYLVRFFFKADYLETIKRVVTNQRIYL